MKSDYKLIGGPFNGMTVAIDSTLTIKNGHIDWFPDTDMFKIGDSTYGSVQVVAQFTDETEMSYICFVHTDLSDDEIRNIVRDLLWAGDRENGRNENGKS